MPKKLMIVAGIAALVAGVVVLGTSASAQIKKGKTRTAPTKYLMRGIMQPNCAGLGKLLEGEDRPMTRRGIRLPVTPRA